MSKFSNFLDLSLLSVKRISGEKEEGKRGERGIRETRMFLGIFGKFTSLAISPG